jgi:hypothetical protein
MSSESDKSDPNAIANDAIANTGELSMNDDDLLQTVVAHARATRGNERMADALQPLDDAARARITTHILRDFRPKKESVAPETNVARRGIGRTATVLASLALAAGVMLRDTRASGIRAHAGRRASNTR